MSCSCGTERTGSCVQELGFWFQVPALLASRRAHRKFPFSSQLLVSSSEKLGACHSTWMIIFYIHIYYLINSSTLHSADDDLGVVHILHHSWRNASQEILIVCPEPIANDRNRNLNASAMNVILVVIFIALIFWIYQGFYRCQIFCLCNLGFSHNYIGADILVWPDQDLQFR